MSFVSPPQQANAANANNKSVSSNAVASQAPAATMATENATEDMIFKQRTFDLYWVNKASLQYREGFAKSFDKESKTAFKVIKMKSSIPLILRDMAPPEGSIFDPARKWEEEQERRRAAKVEEDQANAVVASSKDDKKKKSGGGGGKKNATKATKITAESIKESNQADKTKKDLERDLQKLSNLRTLKTLQDISCETVAGKINRMLKMLHIAVSDLNQGAVGATEAEVLDILWALESMSSFKEGEELINAEKKQKKDAKEAEKKKSSKKDSKKEKKSSKDEVKEEEKPKVVLTSEAKILKDLFKDGGDARGTYKDSLKFARKLMKGKENIISFQLTDMADRLPPLSRYNRQFHLENWQCDILAAIDKKQSAIVCAPTSSGKTLLSTYTCKVSDGTVLFVLPSEVLVWQIAATYYEFFRGNVTICTDQIPFQETTGEAQVYIGTPRALEKALAKVRGCAGEEMAKGEREYMNLDGGYSQFKYIVLDEVHTLNGPEGESLERIIKCCDCPFLALSATVGNAQQLQDWFAKVRNDHVNALLVEAPKKPEEVVLKEHFARFINLQRYVVSESEGKDGKLKQKLVKLHPVAAMTPDRLQNHPELIAPLSMTPTDMIDIWRRLKALFPSDVLEEMDDPDNFFKSSSDSSGRITLTQTKDYEVRLKARLAALSKSHPEMYEKLRNSHLPPPLESQTDVSEKLYDVVNLLKNDDLLPAVAFQLNTYGAFEMFRKLLRSLEQGQNSEFPNYRKDLVKLAREKAAMRKVAAGKADRANAAEAEEDAKSGFTDETLVQEDTTRPHDKYVLSPAGKRLSYNEVEDIISEMKKAGENVDIDHALMRGLRRGIAIYTNEVGFSCYRRQVQILAQKGRLAIVFSDAALAYGVNMPFRSCLFCGEMGSELTPLIAQQMQGRAGRRGLDVQGNVIYLGMSFPYIENLILGQISQVTGGEPRYPIIALEGALAASNDPNDLRHFIHEDFSPFTMALKKLNRTQRCFPTITDHMMEMMTTNSLSDFTRGDTCEGYLEQSEKVIKALGYVDEDLRLSMDHNVLTMVWEMHNFLPEAINLTAVLDQLYYTFCFNKRKEFMESDATQNDFLSVLIHVVDRVPVKEGQESLQERLRVVSSTSNNSILDDEAIRIWKETEETIRKQKVVIDSLDMDDNEKKKMHLVLPPGDDDAMIGPGLDVGVYEMLVLKQKGFRDDQSLERRNELKSRIARLGNICLIAHNNLQQPHGKFDALEGHFRRLFSNIKYSVNDMMTQLTDQSDLTEI